MGKLSNIIQNLTGISPEIQSKIFSSILIIVILVLLRRLVLNYVFKKYEEPQIRYRWQKTSSYVIFVLGIFGIVRIWYVGFTALATFLGLITAGLAIALQELVKSLAGWFFIMWRKPFVVGDRIEIGNIKGDVIDIRLFKFTLTEIGNWVGAEQSTGRILHLPNSMVLSDTIANYTQEFNYIWHEIPVLITFESNWKKAKQLLLEIANKHTEEISQEARKHIKKASRKFLIYYRYVEPIVYTTVKESGILLTIRFLVYPRHRRGIEQAIWENILEEFAQQNDIDLAYPTIRYFNNVTEGKTYSQKIDEKKL